jgi:hypothetical protein
MAQPPSIGSIVPVISRAASLARNTTIAPTPSSAMNRRLG